MFRTNEEGSRKAALAGGTLLGGIFLCVRGGLKGEDDGFLAPMLRQGKRGETARASGPVDKRRGWGPVMCHDVWNYGGGRGPGGRQKRGPDRGGGRSGGVARTGEEEGGRSGLVDRYGPTGVDRSEMNIGFFELF
jgi:hypothetical protein